eukprot:1196415-Prorocentrum_minimum.AAC.3
MKGELRDLPPGGYGRPAGARSANPLQGDARRVRPAAGHANRRPRAAAAGTLSALTRPQTAKPFTNPHYALPHFNLFCVAMSA